MMRRDTTAVSIRLCVSTWHPERAGARIIAKIGIKAAILLANKQNVIDRQRGCLRTHDRGRRAPGKPIPTAQSKARTSQYTQVAQRPATRLPRGELVS